MNSIVIVMLVYLSYLISMILAYLSPPNVYGILLLSEIMLILSFFMLLSEAFKDEISR